MIVIVYVITVMLLTAALALLMRVNMQERRERRALIAANEPSPKMLRTPWEEHLLDIELGIIPEDTVFGGERTRSDITLPPPDLRKPRSISQKPERSNECTSQIPYRITALTDGKEMYEYRQCDCTACQGRTQSPVVTVKKHASVSDAVPDWREHITVLDTSKGPRYGYTCQWCHGWWTATTAVFAADNSVGHECVSTVYKSPEPRYRRTNSTGPK